MQINPSSDPRWKARERALDAMFGAFKRQVDGMGSVDLGCISSTLSGINAVSRRYLTEKCWPWMAARLPIVSCDSTEHLARVKSLLPPQCQIAVKSSATPSQLWLMRWSSLAETRSITFTG